MIAVQYDCAADVDEYIHRVGRTARMDTTGYALLMLTEQQRDRFLPLLAQRRIAVKEVA